MARGGGAAPPPSSRTAAASRGSSAVTAFSIAPTGLMSTPVLAPEWATQARGAAGWDGADNLDSKNTRAGRRLLDHPVGSMHCLPITTASPAFKCPTSPRMSPVTGARYHVRQLLTAMKGICFLILGMSSEVAQRKAIVLPQDRLADPDPVTP